MKFFLDTEFIERGRKHPIELISIGLVSGHGHTFYAESSEFVAGHANPWVQANVLPHLGDPALRLPVDEIARRIKMFISQCLLQIGRDERPEFWADYASYDWVVFCQIFGTTVDLPGSWPMFCRDIQQLAEIAGGIRLPSTVSPHNAMHDAQKCYEDHYAIVSGFRSRLAGVFRV